MIRALLQQIEIHRSNQQLRWKVAVGMKDSFWFLLCYIPIQSKNFLNYIIISRLRQYFDASPKKSVATHQRISFCITAMNRLKHIKRTLPRNLRDTSSYPNAEFVLLDYNSTDGLEKWVFSRLSGYIQSGRLVYLKTTEPNQFHMAKAKNMAHYHATGTVLCNLDADHYTGRNFAFHINLIMNADMNTIGRGPKKLPDSGGRIFISRENYLRLGGYDERYCGWGHEDTDFYERALHSGFTPHEIPRYFVEHIRHSDELRVTHMNVSIEESAEYNEKLLEETVKKKTTVVPNNWSAYQPAQTMSASSTRLICSTK